MSFVRLRAGKGKRLEVLNTRHCKICFDSGIVFSFFYSVLCAAGIIFQVSTVSVPALGAARLDASIPCNLLPAVLLTFSLTITLHRHADPHNVDYE